MHRYDLFKARMTSADPLRDVRFAIRKALRSGHRVWLVGSYDLPPGRQAPPVLRPAPAEPWGWRDAPYAVRRSSRSVTWMEDGFR